MSIFGSIQRLLARAASLFGRFALVIAIGAAGEIGRPISQPGLDRSTVAGLLENFAGLSLITAAAAAPTTGPFGRATYLAPEGPLWVKWQKAQADIASEAPILFSCRNDPDRCISPAAARFVAIIEDARARKGQNRLEAVHRAVNAAIRSTPDIVLHGVPERWTAPLAAFELGQGDCEEFAIAKYVALREAGVQDDDLRLVLGFDQRIREYHLVLAAREGGRWFILDNNRIPIVEDSEFTRFVPLFVLNELGVRQYGMPSPPGGFRLRDIVPTISRPGV